jgi:hypothetical protein
MHKTRLSLTAISLAFLVSNCFCPAIQAQTSNYEFTVIVPLDEFAVKNAAQNDTLKSLNTIFFAALDAQEYDATPLYNALKNRKNLNWFADKNCTQPIKVNFKMCDTLLRAGKIEGVTCSEQVNGSDFVVAYALRHFVKYNAATQKMNLEVVAIAPIVTRYNTKGQKYRHYLGWLSLNSEKNGIPNPAAKDNFAFAKRTTLFIKNSDAKPLVESAVPLSQTLFEAAQQKKIKIYDSHSATEPLSAQAFADMQVARMDTVVTYNPETYEESMKIVKNEGVKAANICGLRYNLVYSFDEKNFTLTAKIEGLGIEEQNKDKDGKILYQTPAFYIKPE